MSTESSDTLLDEFEANRAHKVFKSVLSDLQCLLRHLLLTLLTCVKIAPTLIVLTNIVLKRFVESADVSVNQLFGGHDCLSLVGGGRLVKLLHYIVTGLKLALDSYALRVGVRVGRHKHALIYNVVFVVSIALFL